MARFDVGDVVRITRGKYENNYGVVVGHKGKFDGVYGVLTNIDYEIDERRYGVKINEKIYWFRFRSLKKVLKEEWKVFNIIES